MARQWEIWDVRWRHETGDIKERPALVLRIDGGIAIGAKISSVKHQKPLVMFDPEDLEWTELGLNKRCFLYFMDQQELHIDGDLVRRRGELGLGYGEFVRKKLYEHGI